MSHRHVWTPDRFDAQSYLTDAALTGRVEVSQRCACGAERRTANTLLGYGPPGSHRREVTITMPNGARTVRRSTVRP